MPEKGIELKIGKSNASLEKYKYSVMNVIIEF